MNVCRFTVQCLRTVFFLSVLSVVSWGGVSSIHAMSILLPTGLNPGDTYQLAFQSRGTRNALSTDIADYNMFVQNAANAAGIGFGSSFLGDVTWRAIGSTSTVSARDNALVSTSVYNLNDQILALGFDDMWDGDLSNPILFDELGNSNGFTAWTGTGIDGMPSSNVLGDPTQSTLGIGGITNEFWIDRGPFPSSGTRTLYALSEPITVPQTPVPVPSSILLFGSGLVGLVGWRWWKGNLT
ncbi:MAG: hypothetical protein NPIRA02_09430 [Nitrospirales bacterium]|nr:MAG: hypothetical protein NPIRA02_09430 [Nitrospirales bacterium]